MSRFDEWAKLSAQGESPLRAWRRGRAARSVASSAAGIDRRELLKKATLVGGATIIGSSLIQSVTSPALAVSGVCADQRGCGTGTGCVGCAAGQSCSTGAECLSLVCNQHGVCAAGDLQDCGTGSQGQRNAMCASGKCNPTTNTCLLSSGKPCATNDQCGSNKCENAAPLGGTPGTCK